MVFPAELKYTKDHEWAKIEGKILTVGITDHAQSALGDIVYIDLPQVGRELKKGETFGVVESIKAVSDLYAPCSGKVVAANTDLVSNPSVINQEPHARWMIRIDVSNTAELSELMDANAYSALVASL